MDPQKVEQFRQKAISSGYNPALVEKYLQQQLQTQSIMKQLNPMLMAPEQAAAEAYKTQALAPYQASAAAQAAAASAQATAPISVNTDLAKTMAETAFAQQNAPKALELKVNETKAIEKAKNDVAIQQKFKDVASNLTLLEKNYNQVSSSDKGPIAGGLAELFSGLTKGASNPDVADYEALRKSMIGPLARGISGEVGVLTDRDISRAEGLLPKVSDDPRAAQKKLDNLKEIIKNKLGDQYTQQAASSQSPPAALPQAPAAMMSQAPKQSLVSPQPSGLAFQAAQQRAQQPQPTQSSPIDAFNQMIFKNVAQGPVGDATEGLLRLLNPRIADVASRSGQGQPVSGDQMLGAGGEFALDALPFMKGLQGAGLIAKATGIAGRSALGGILHGATTPGASGGDRVANAGIEGTLAGLLGLIPGGVGAAKSKLTIGGQGAARNAAVQAANEVTVSGDEIAKAGREYLAHDPTAKNVAAKILPGIEGKDIPLADLMKKIKVWNDAYTASGKVGKSAEAGLNDALARKAKELIWEQAPNVAQATQNMANIFKTRNTISKTAQLTGATAGAAGGIMYLLNLLKGNGGSPQP